MQKGTKERKVMPNRREVFQSITQKMCKAMKNNVKKMQHNSLSMSNTGIKLYLE